MSVENLNEIINQIIIPAVQVGFPLAITIALVEKLIQFIINCIKGNKEVKF